MIKTFCIQKERILLGILGLASAIATFVALTSSASCTAWVYEQPKMPKTLLKRD